MTVDGTLAAVNGGRRCHFRPSSDGEVPPTGKAISYESAVLWTFDSDGLIAEERSYFDATGVAAQLGLIS